MKLTEDGSNVFSGGGVGKQSGSRVLYILQFLKNSGGDTECYCNSQVCK